VASHEYDPRERQKNQNDNSQNFGELLRFADDDGKYSQKKKGIDPSADGD
jgi:hypothetical protein